MQKIFNSSISKNLNVHTLAPKINFFQLEKIKHTYITKQNNDIMHMTHIYEIKHQIAGSKGKTFYKSPLDTD